MEKIENNSQGVLALTNKVRMEAKDVKGIGLSLDAFPQKLQDIIFEVARIEQFDLEYLTLSMLSAAATTIGNSCHIRIRGSWKSCPALYVILMPDLGATKKWTKKSAILTSICKSVTISTVLEQMATDEQREAGLDISDFLLMQETKQMILQRMIERNPALQLLIDKLQLELVE